MNKIPHSKKVVVEINYDDALSYVSKCFNYDQLERFYTIAGNKMSRSTGINFFVNPPTIYSEMKLELLSEAFKKYSLEELEKRLG